MNKAAEAFAKFRQLYAVSRMLTSGLLPRVALIAAFLRHVVSNRYGLGRKKGMRVSLSSFGSKFEFTVTQSVDIAVMNEVFVQGEYYVKAQKPNVIVDLGSNTGVSVAYFALRYPSARIYAFEPDPSTFKVLSENCKQFPNVAAFNKAIATENSKVGFYVHPSSTISSSSLRRLQGQERIAVDGISLDSIFSLVNADEIDLLKFDIEGSEYDVLLASRSLSKIKKLIGEFHADLSGRSLEEFEELLSSGHTMSYRAISKSRYIVEGSRINNE